MAWTRHLMMPPRAGSEVAAVPEPALAGFRVTRQQQVVGSRRPKFRAHKPRHEISDIS
jgi:hypothetical protein